MTAQSLALTFQSTAFSVIDRNGEPWLKASELAQALGYKKVDAVTQIYDRNKDEFTDRMTQTLNLRVAENKDLCNSDAIRIFSLRGAHLVAMFARTAVAKDFRVWVLDIIDQHLGRQQTETLIPSEQQILQEIVAQKAANLPSDLQGKAIKEAWSRLHHKFRIAKYSQLPRTQLTDAIVYLTTMVLRCVPSPQPLPASPQITGNDQRNLQRVIWMIADHMRFRSSIRSAIWYALRQATGWPSPHRFEERHLPVIAAELQRILEIAVAYQQHQVVMEQEFIRRAIRHREIPAIVIGQMREVEQKWLKESHPWMAQLDRWHQEPMTNITLRGPSAACDHSEYAEPRAY